MKDILTQFVFDESLRRQIAERLEKHALKTIERADLRMAAVTIVLVPDADSGETCFLLTRRQTKLKRHSGQFALPGGRVDAGETDIDAALRELHEELGLRAKPINVLGALDDFATRSGYRIRPFVLWVEDATSLAPDPNEVAACFQIPVSDLTSPEIPMLRAIKESDQPVLSAPIRSLAEEVFAPTAALLYQFRELALAGRSTRVSHFEQPLFAWK